MKKTEKRILGLLLAVLMMFQLPFSVFAEELETGNIVVPSYEEEAVYDTEPIENEELIEEANSIEDLSDSTEEDLYEKELLDETDVLLDETETEEEQILEEETEVQTGQEEIATLSAKEAAEETQEIHVTVSVSKDGKFLDDKDGNPMAGREITLTGQTSYTMDDALKTAHDLYYRGGSEAGYDYHADEAGKFDGIIYKLWGYSREEVPYIKAALNRDCGNYQSALNRTIKNDDDLHFYIEQRKGIDQLAFFTETSLTVTEGNDIELKLRQIDSNGKVITDCKNAVIYIDGEKKEDLVTDDNGKVIIKNLPTRKKPYFITVEKLDSSADGLPTMISAAYTNVIVNPSTSLTGDYLKSITLKEVIDGKENTASIEIQDGDQRFVVPAEMVYLHYQKRSDMYLSVDLKESLPENYKIYAVYSDPRDETIHRVEIKAGKFSYLKNAVAKGVTYGDMLNYNQAIRSVRLEVTQSGTVIEKKEIPIIYRNHLSKLSVTTSFGNEVPTGFSEDSLDNQNLEIEVPENAEYVEIASQPYGYTDTNKTISVNGETKELSYYQTYELNLDWEKCKEYHVSINIIESGKIYCPEDAEYTITIKKGGVDYTPKVKLNVSGKHSVLKNSQSPVIKANASVLRQEDGSLSYQWYRIDTIENYERVYNPIDGATQETYEVPTDKRGNEISYSCQVIYTIDGKEYEAMSPSVDYTVISSEVEMPEIQKQPGSILCVAGKPITEKLDIELEETPWEDLTPLYQWYQNTEENTETGTRISGATKKFYEPSVPEEGTIYYYCRVQYRRWEWNLTEGSGSSHTDGMEVCSDIVSVSVIEEELPWEGSGSAKDPYKINGIEDLEALRDKVNKEGFSFAGMHFQMTADISLPSDWAPIGTIEPGKTMTGDGKYLWAFSGIFEGNGHTLAMSEGGKPLFNYVRNAVVEDLKLAGENINGYGLVDRYTVDYGVDGEYDTGCPDAVTIRNVTLTSGMSTKKAGLIGGYASGANDVVIENCNAEAGVIIGYTKQEGSIGTFAGSINGVIRNCHSAATVYGTSAVGGLVGSKGQAMGACTIENSSFTGNVIATGNWVGGILGKGYEADSAPNTPVASVKNCYVAGNVSGASNVGGIFGGEPSCKQCWGNGSGAIANNFFYGTVSGNSNVGAIVGYLRSFDKFQGITNNYFLDTCGASNGIGGIGTILTVDGSLQDLPYEVDASYGIDYKFDQKLYCFPKSAAEFADGTVTGGLNSGDYNNWEQGSSYPVYGAGAYATGLSLTGNYKKEYYLGEELDLSGGTFTVTWSDGTKTHPEANEITVVGYDPNKRGSQMLSLKYGAVETTITVGVILRAGQIEVSFTLLGDYVHDSDADQNYHTLNNGTLETWIPETKMIVSNNAKVKDVLEQALQANGMTCENPKGNYVSAITRNGVKLAEFTNGKNSGWMYTLNGKHPDLGVNEQYLNNGDVIVFHYTDDYVNEEHVHHWAAGWSSNGVVHWHECEWACGQRKDQASHSWSAWKTTKAATYTTAAVQTRYCTVCGREQTQSVGSPLPQPAPKPNPTMQVNASRITLKYGQSTTGLKVTGLQSGDYVQSYKSSNTKIFKVNGNGKITAKKKAGRATLTITLKSGLSRNVTVTVQKGTVKTAKVSGVAKKITLNKGKKYTLKPVITPFTSQEKVTYTSSNKKVAKVTSRGVITAKKSGTAKITVKSGKKKAVLTVTVPKTATKSISVASAISVKKGKTYTLKAKRTPANSEEKITYRSSNKKVATVTNSGKIKGVKKGTATITVKSGKVTKKVTVTVK